ncbi:MAG: ATP-binding protein, partial [Deltaproteobacteria bacterium]|nr:ATP-binding protein [Deltaproteobacteria bacterium]
YHQNFKVQTRDPKKVYSVDTGLWTAVSRSIHDDSTRLLENIVCVELRRREKEVSYFKERYELDFIVSENYKPVEAIQVCYDLSDPVTRERELRALGEGMDVLGLNRGSIISYDHEERLNIDGKNIDIVPIYTWLS